MTIPWIKEFDAEFIPFFKERNFNLSIGKIPYPEPIQGYKGGDCRTGILTKYYRIYQARRVADMFAFVKTLPIVEGHGDYNMVFFFWDKVPVTRDELSEIGVPLCWCGYDMSMQLETDFSYDGRSGAYFLARVVDKIRDRLEPDWSAPWIPTFTDDFKL